MADIKTEFFQWTRRILGAASDHVDTANAVLSNTTAVTRTVAARNLRHHHSSTLRPVLHNLSLIFAPITAFLTGVAFIFEVADVKNRYNTIKTSIDRANLLFRFFLMFAILILTIVTLVIAGMAAAICTIIGAGFMFKHAWLGFQENQKELKMLRSEHREVVEKIKTSKDVLEDSHQKIAELTERKKYIEEKIFEINRLVVHSDWTVIRGELEKFLNGTVHLDKLTQEKLPIIIDHLRTALESEIQSIEEDIITHKEAISEHSGLLKEFLDEKSELEKDIHSVKSSRRNNIEEMVVNSIAFAAGILGIFSPIKAFALMALTLVGGVTYIAGKLAYAGIQKVKDRFFGAAAIPVDSLSEGQVIISEKEKNQIKKEITLKMQAITSQQMSVLVQHEEPVDKEVLHHHFTSKHDQVGHLASETHHLAEQKTEPADSTNDDDDDENKRLLG